MQTPNAKHWTLNPYTLNYFNPHLYTPTTLNTTDNRSSKLVGSDALTLPGEEGL